MSKLVNLMIHTIPRLDDCYRDLATTFLDKQSKCRKLSLSGKSMGRAFVSKPTCGLLTCTFCYNEKLLKLQKELLESLKLSIKNRIILERLAGFVPSKDNSLIAWVERNKAKLAIKLDDFKAVFCTLSPKNVIAESTYQSFEEIKEQMNLLYEKLSYRIGLFSLLDFRCVEQSKLINTHVHSIILFNKNIIYSDIGRDMRYNTDEVMKVFLSQNGYQDQSNSQWIKSYYDLFRVIAYITKPRENNFEESIVPFSWLKLGLSIYYDHTQGNQSRRYRNYALKDSLKKMRTESNKRIKQEKLFNELSTPMDVKKDDHVKIGSHKKSHYFSKLKKEAEYSYQNTNKIILTDGKQNIIHEVKLYKKTPHQFYCCEEKLDKKHIKELSATLNISTAKIKSLIITRQKFRWMKGKKRRFQKVRIV